MGKREGNNLPGIRRVGQNLLIAGHGGVETDFADRDAYRTRALALDDGAVGEHEQRRGALLAPGGGRPRAWAQGLCGRHVWIVVHRLSLCRLSQGGWA